MGDVNQVMYLKERLPTLAGSILEIGSKDYGNTATFRDFYHSNTYVGVDLEAGANVDVVADLTVPDHGLEKNSFSLVICCSVLEHVKKPWLFAPIVSELVKPGGYLYISVPWVWPYHAFPDDYYRFSHRGVEVLFDAFEWSDITYATGTPGEFTPLDLNAPYQDLGMVLYKPLRRLISRRYIPRKLAQWLKITRKERASFENSRTYLPFLMLNMIGKKRFSDSRESCNSAD
jgi:SAM-dependent methyltransferase